MLETTDFRRVQNGIGCGYLREIPEPITIAAQRQSNRACRPKIVNTRIFRFAKNFFAENPYKQLRY